MHLGECRVNGFDFDLDMGSALDPSWGLGTTHSYEPGDFLRSAGGKLKGLWDNSNLGAVYSSGDLRPPADPNWQPNIAPPKSPGGWDNYGPTVVTSTPPPLAQGTLTSQDMAAPHAVPQALVPQELGPPPPGTPTYRVSGYSPAEIHNANVAQGTAPGPRMPVGAASSAPGSDMGLGLSAQGRTLDAYRQQVHGPSSFNGFAKPNQPGPNQPGPNQPGNASPYVPLGGSMAGARFADVPTSGGAPNSREWGGPRGSGRHAGIDIPGKVGDPVYMSPGGTVLRASQGQGYGNYVDAQAPDGTVHRMGHLNSIAPGMKEGAQLGTNAQVGGLGHTGNAGPGFPHAHYEVFPNRDAYDRASGQSSRASWQERSDPREWFSKYYKPLMEPSAGLNAVPESGLPKLSLLPLPPPGAPSDFRPEGPYGGAVASRPPSGPGTRSAPRSADAAAEPSPEVLPWAQQTVASASPLDGMKSAMQPYKKQFNAFADAAGDFGKAMQAQSQQKLPQFPNTQLAPLQKTPYRWIG